MNEIEKKALEILIDAGVTVEVKGDEVEILEYDSLVFIAAVVELEQCFNIEIPAEYLNEEFLGSFQNVVDVVSGLMAA